MFLDSDDATKDSIVGGMKRVKQLLKNAGIKVEYFFECDRCEGELDNIEEKIYRLCEQPNCHRIIEGCPQCLENFHFCEYHIQEDL